MSEGVKTPDTPEMDRLSAIHRAIEAATTGDSSTDVPIKGPDAARAQAFLEELEAEGYTVTSTHLGKP